VVVFTYSIIYFYTGADPGFQVRGAHLKKMRRAEGGAKNFEVFRVKITILRQKIIFFPMAEGGAKIFGVFRVENHNFTPKNHIFFQWRRVARKFLGYFVWKIMILRQKIIFFPILGGGGGALRVRSPWIRPCYIYVNKWLFYFNIELCIL
jgi:hypothetical protein